MNLNRYPTWKIRAGEMNPEDIITHIEILEEGPLGFYHICEKYRK